MADNKPNIPVKVDVEHMCVDRTTEEGRMFDELNKQAQAKAGTPEGNFMAQMLGFTEAAMVISSTMQGKEAEDALEELRNAMGSMVNG